MRSKLYFLTGLYIGKLQQIVTESLAQFNDLEKFNSSNPSQEVSIIAATNHPSMIDPAVW
jgi:SpoVK/Ycf46/Vps4 family AAA+-type ATPase